MHNGHQTQGWQKTSSGGKGPVFGTGPYLVQLSEFEVRYRPRQPQHHRISERQALVTSGEAVFRERSPIRHSRGHWDKHPAPCLRTVHRRAEDAGDRGRAAEGASRVRSLHASINSTFGCWRVIREAPTGRVSHGVEPDGDAARRTYHSARHLHLHGGAPLLCLRMYDRYTLVCVHAMTGQVPPVGPSYSLGGAPEQRRT
jgi:hypothetical protein